MNVLNIRIGFATNSSSTHSIVFIPNKADLAKIKDKPKSSPAFGWDDFLLKSPNEKQKYFISLLCTSIKNDIPDRIASLIAKDLVNYQGDMEIDPENWYVDHQSAYEFPLTRDLKDINKEFALDFYNYIMQKDIVICGGNDNGGLRDAELLSGIEYKDAGVVGYKDTYGTLFAKKQKDQVWTLFNYNTGAKVTVSFSNKPTTFTKSRTPDLIDLKITNWCDNKCPFCYQDSNTKGTHADYDKIRNIISALSDMEVFEIALGGGSPVAHPNFINILEYCRELGVIPNFSTRDTNWLKNPKIVEAVKNHVGSVGFSVVSMKEVEDLSYLIEKSNLHEGVDNFRKRNPISIHYVMGSTDLGVFKNIIGASIDYGYNVILLGYKTTGRGASFKPYPYKGWLDIIKGYPLFGIGIDTSLAKEYEKELKKNKINDKTYYTEEGKSSAYIDAVDLKIGPSSYCPPEQMTSLVLENNYLYNIGDMLKEAYNGY